VQVRLPRGVTVTAAVAGQLHVLALTTGGGVLAWGSNHFGQLGTGTTATRHIPVRVKLPTGTTKIRALAAGADFSVALTAGARILTWGHGSVGQLGNASTADRHRPVRVQLPFGFTPIAIGAGLTSESALAIGHEVI
jgi:alpha-tubulin suppressor-like RCC1 family protein